MKQLSKLESAIFLLGGVLMVVGAACFAFGFSHPQLVQVTRGVGKTTCARIFAKAINCEHPREDGAGSPPSSSG
jgi:hypothetical protein